MRRGRVPGRRLSSVPGRPARIPFFSGRGVREPSPMHLKQKTEYVFRIPS